MANFSAQFLNPVESSFLGEDAADASTLDDVAVPGCRAGLLHRVVVSLKAKGHLETEMLNKKPNGGTKVSLKASPPND
jgi:hypothetical protein